MVASKKSLTMAPSLEPENKPEGFKKEEERAERHSRYRSEVGDVGLSNDDINYPRGLTLSKQWEWFLRELLEAERPF